MKSYVISILVCFYSAFSLAQTMMFGDTSRLVRPFSQDPHAERLEERTGQPAQRAA